MQETIDQLQSEGIELRNLLDQTLSPKQWENVNRLIEIELLLEQECNK